MKFILQFLKQPRYIGAVAPSSRFLARKMVKPINFRKANCIVEYGSGTGSFTKELAKRKRKETKLILIEQNSIFCDILNKKYKDRNDIYVINGSAENVTEYIKEAGYENASYIVSGLPFTSLPAKVSSKILEETKKAIGGKGRFIIFQYSLIKKSFFEKYFKISKCLFEFRNILPAYVFVMRNKSLVKNDYTDIN